MAMLNNQMVISNSKYSKPQMLTLFDRQWRYMPKTNPQPACNIRESCVAKDQCCPREQHSTDA